jgi:hypothetical protein
MLTETLTHTIDVCLALMVGSSSCPRLSCRLFFEGACLLHSVCKQGAAFPELTLAHTGDLLCAGGTANMHMHWRALFTQLLTGQCLAAGIENATVCSI